LGWVIYKYVSQQKTESVLTEAPASAGDSAPAQQNKTKDSVNMLKPLSANTGDSLNYKFVFETTLNKVRAHNRYDSLKSWGEHVFIDSIGGDTSTVYHLFIKARLTAKDTTYVKDSIQKYFQRPVRIFAN
jgi:hypothetical protein